ncbi:MAG: hypothetical protein K9I68_00080 [Bacteroidales bacterium]|nr:hypothetical protein [Bacteroidales bacterium]MCF8336769.1 hypothetical protein [Bacteroidales bacterium]
MTPSGGSMMKKPVQKRWPHLFCFFLLLFGVTGKVNSQVMVKLEYPVIDSLDYSDVWKFRVVNKSGKTWKLFARARITSGNDSVVYHAATEKFKLKNSISMQRFSDTSFRITPSHSRGVISGNTSYTFCIYLVVCKNRNILSRDCLRIVLNGH